MNKGGLEKEQYLFAIIYSYSLFGDSGGRHSFNFFEKVGVVDISQINTKTGAFR